MVSRLAATALLDAGIELGEVDGFLHPGLRGIAIGTPAIIEMLGLRCRFSEHVELGGATSAGMISRAAMAISA